MRVLVTGASGLIGSAVCDALLARGDEVVGLSRDPARAREHQPDRLLARLGPGQRAPAGRRVRGRRRGRQPDRREHQPAAHRRRPRSGSATAAVRATKNLVDGMLAAAPTPDDAGQPGGGRLLRRPRRGDRRRVDPARRRTCSPQIVRRVGGRGAAGAERGGVRVVVLRTGLVLDPEGGLLKQLLPPFKLGVGGPLAGGDQYMPWIHRDDEVGLILWALDNAEVSGAAQRRRRRTRSPTASSRRRSARALHRPAVAPGPEARASSRCAARSSPSRSVGSLRVDPAPRARPRLRVPLRRARAGAARPARA